jgi:DNA-binding NarL/FixJ family response regulator
MIQTPAEVVPMIVPKNCFRCGDEFRARSGERVCAACRKPKAEVREFGGKQLSFREKQIVALISQAKLNKEIAYALHLSEGTVKEYINRIFRKLSLGNRTALAVWALTTGGVADWQMGELFPVAGNIHQLHG